MYRNVHLTKDHPDEKKTKKLKQQQQYTHNDQKCFRPHLWICGILALGINYASLSQLTKQSYRMNRVGATKENEINTFENPSLQNRTRCFQVIYY